MKIVCAISILSVIVGTGCASGARHEERVFLDSSTHEDRPPSWVQSTRVVWEDKDRVWVRASHSVRGNERVNGCLDLAGLDAREVILSEISNDVRGTIDSAESSLSENAEVVLGKARSSEFKGRLQGLRISEQYFERYLVSDVERVDCYVLAEIRSDDYERLKRQLLDEVVAADPRIKEAIIRKQADFFRKDKDVKTDARAPAANPQDSDE